MKFNDEFVTAPWGKICVIRGGQSGKALLLVHGMLDNGGGLQLLASRIHPEHRVFIVELPGCGHSDPYPPGLPLHVEIFVEVLRRVVDHYDLKEFYFIGHSMGVQIGLLYNAAYPGRIQKFAAIDYLMYPPIEPEQYREWYQTTLETYFRDDVYKKRTSSSNSAPSYTFNEALELIMKIRGISKEAATSILQRCLKVVPSTDKYRFTHDQRFKQVIVPHLTVQNQLHFVKNCQMPFLLISVQHSIGKHISPDSFTILNTFYESNPNFQVEITKGNHNVHLNDLPKISNMISQFFKCEGTTKVTKYKTMEYVKVIEKILNEKIVNNTNSKL